MHSALIIDMNFDYTILLIWKEINYTINNGSDEKKQQMGLPLVAYFASKYA